MKAANMKRRTPFAQKSTRIALSFLASFVLAMGLMPGIAMADDSYPDQNQIVVAPTPDGTTTVDVGNVTVDAEDAGTLPAACAAATHTDATLTVHGDVEVTGNDRNLSVAGKSNSSEGHEAITHIEGNATVNVNDINENPEENPCEVDGVEAHAGDPGSYSEMTVGGDVTATLTSSGNRWVTAFGVYQYAHTDEVGDVATSTVTVNGDVTAEAINGSSEVTGMDLYADNSAQVLTVIKGSVSASGTYATGMSVGLNEAAQPPINPETTATVSVGEDVTTSGEKAADGVATDNRGGTITVHVAGDVTSTVSNADGITTGIYAAGEDGFHNILVEGTVTSKSYGVTDATTGGAIDVTVWRVESDCVGAKVDFDQNIISEDAELEAAINYIIKLEQPEEGNILRLAGTTAKEFTDAGGTYSFDVAHMGERVYLDVADGWVITGAFSDQGKSVELEQDADGRWYVTVPNGGGVYLSATVAPRMYDLTFNLGGGTVDGTTGTLTINAAYGSSVTLPTPIRDGYKFLYWEGSRYDAGASYLVEGAHVFTAVWQQEETPEPAPRNGSGGQDASSNSLPATADPCTGTSTTVLLLALASGAALIACGIMLRRRED